MESQERGLTVTGIEGPLRFVRSTGGFATVRAGMRHIGNVGIAGFGRKKSACSKQAFSTSSFTWSRGTWPAVAGAQATLKLGCETIMRKEIFFNRATYEDNKAQFLQNVRHPPRARSICRLTEG